jgi:hypothetical protein
MTETKSISEIKSAAEQHTFLCESCKAINENPNIREEVKFVHTKEGMGNMILDQDPDDMPDQSHIDPDNIVKQTLLFWDCSVCKQQHRIIGDSDEPVPFI